MDEIEDVTELYSSEDFEYDNIVERMKNDLTNPASLLEGSFAMDIIQSVAQEESRAVTMRLIAYIDQALLDTAEGEYLDRIAINYGMERNEATPSSGYVVITGTDGTVIPEGTRFESNDYTFITQEEVVIADGTATVLCTCSEGGRDTNVLAGSIFECTDDIDDDITCTNNEDFTGGTDEESDDAFRSRILEKIQQPIASGNANSYIYWAKQISGVGNARVVPLYDGAGTVKVIIINDEGSTPSEALIAEVTEYIEEQRPIGASVLVVGAESCAIVLAGTIELEDGYDLEDVTSAIQETITEYLTTIAFDSSVKSLSFYKISDLIFNVTGVADVISYTINGGTSSITASDDEFFELTEVTFNAD